MKNILILGANGKIAKMVEKRLAGNEAYSLTLALRDANRLNDLQSFKNIKIVEGDVSNRKFLERVIPEQDIVYVNLNGDMERFARLIVEEMDLFNIKKLIWITGSGLYHETLDPFGSWVENRVGHLSKENTRRAARIIETSNLEYTIIRAAYMVNEDEINYELTRKGETFKGTIISRTSIADFVVKVINNPSKYMCESFGISEPGTDSMERINQIENGI
ncbi:NAD(P)H-binding protein [Companilactobacillus jidongensis]|uniref:NAD(P)H-binding protein n=1 Tax=Companilactobacillus jidongensis TaxID=2486006 RepID=UPI000F791EF1|nr:NAD(P)H-binding protein [Companilactobacillus jidongensis]